MYSYGITYSSEGIEEAWARFEIVGPHYFSKISPHSTRMGYVHAFVYSFSSVLKY